MGMADRGGGRGKSGRRDGRDSFLGQVSTPYEVVQQASNVSSRPLPYRRSTLPLMWAFAAQCLARRQAKLRVLWQAHVDSQEFDALGDYADPGLAVEQLKRDAPPGTIFRVEYLGSGCEQSAYIYITEVTRDVDPTQ